ncbi:hypothetical protein AAMO2058_001681700 [Amorphochlora amoebiformis]
MARKKPVSGKHRRSQLKLKRKTAANRKSAKDTKNDRESQSHTRKAGDPSDRRGEKGRPQTGLILGEESHDRKGGEVGFGLGFGVGPGLGLGLSSSSIVTSFGGRIDTGDTVEKRERKGRLATFFIKEDDRKVNKRKKNASNPINRHPTSIYEADEAFATQHPVFCHPRRPQWAQRESKQVVEAREEAMFGVWVNRVLTWARLVEEVTPFELNIDVWRQLWRVCEFSSVVVIVCDVRYPTFHIPPSLFNHLTQDISKRVMIVVNKVDLVPCELVERWCKWLKARYPNTPVVTFSSRPIDPDTHNKTGINSRRKRLHKRVSKGVYKKHLDEQARKIIKAAAPLLTPNPKGFLVLGVVGHPNVGKTSIVNALCGTKRASTSSTAGHTKHLQHLPIPHILENGVVVDCPGLVFPRPAPRHLTELMGLYPIAQIRETYSAVRFLAQRLKLEKLYGLRKPDWYDEDDPWTPLMICEALGEKKGYDLTRGGAHRVGLEILKDCTDGALLLAFHPNDTDPRNNGDQKISQEARVNTPFGPGIVRPAPPESEWSLCSVHLDSNAIAYIGAATVSQIHKWNEI